MAQEQKPGRRALTLNELEIEIVRVIKKWRDSLIDDNGERMIQDIDAGDAATLASDIALEVIGTQGVKIIGELKVDRKLSEGWE